jgi:hypothetical protein
MNFFFPRSSPQRIWNTVTRSITNLNQMLYLGYFSLEVSGFDLRSTVSSGT